MPRRRFGREFKVEAVRLIKERGVAVAQAARDLDVHENVLRKWVEELSADPAQAFPGAGQVKPDQLEIDRLRREVSKLKAGRDILKKGDYVFDKHKSLMYVYGQGVKPCPSFLSRTSMTKPPPSPA